MSGASFAAASRRLAGLAGAVLGWAPDIFWRATPADLLAVVAVLTGDGATASPPDAVTLARLKEAFPDV